MTRHLNGDVNFDKLIHENMFYSVNAGFRKSGHILYRIFRKGGKNHLAPPTYQETVPITNALTARIRLCKVFLNSCIPFCCNSCHFAAVYALKPPYYNTQKGGRFSKGGGEVPRLPPPCMNHCTCPASCTYKLANSVSALL